MGVTPIIANLNSELITAFRETEFHSGNPEREESIHFLESTGLPNGKAEEYRFTPIYKSLEKNFLAQSFTRFVPSSITHVEEFLIPNYECNLIVFVNGQYQQQFSKIISPKEQLTVLSLHQALNEKTDWVLAHFSKLVEATNDAFAALNTAFWRDGICIEIPDNTLLEKPILVLHLHDATNESVVSTTRLVMQLGKKSEASLVEKFESVGKNPVFNSFVEEISLAEQAKLNYCKIQNDEGSLYHVTNTLIHQASSSRVDTFTFSLNGQLIRNNFGIAIDGAGCESHFFGLYLLDKNTLADNHTVVDHRKPNSFSNQLYKGIMDGNSKGVFNGKIYVRPNAQKTNAFQSNRNILVSDTATINTKPQLEIWADDVKCSHGCTSGQLDEEALFYLQSRGISKNAAQGLLLSAFAGEILDPMNDLLLKNYISQVISGRLEKNWKS